MAADIAAVVVGAFAAQDRAQAIDGFAHTRRTVRPLAVVPARHDERAGRTQRDIDVATGERGAMDTGVRTLTGSGPTRSPNPGARRPTAVASAKASKVAISPIQSPLSPAALAASAMSNASASGASSQNGSTTSIGALTALPPRWSGPTEFGPAAREMPR
jgi:hypothetical protein